MSRFLNIDAEDLETLKLVLQPILANIYAFGSRVRGDAIKFSDLDLCYKGELDRKLIRSIKEQLRNSNLPFKVDLISYDESSCDFQNSIKDDLLKLDFT